MSLAASTRLGPYEVLGLIGAGGMGEVYKARDTRLDRTVAIKILPPDISADPDRRARFEREAKSIAGLAHPHICTLYDVGEDAGAMFLVMEHLEGETLAHRLEKGPLPIDQALTIGIEIAEALSAAHRHGIIHRDLKPANVMLTRTGAKLLDFGLAKLTARGEQPAVANLVSAPTRTAPLTGEGVIVGTLQYMAPEQVEGREADARTDLWALGCLLYEMVTGQRAFAGETPGSLIGAILAKEPEPLSTRQPLTPPGLEWLVTRCLAKDPDQRWDSAHDLAAEIRWVFTTHAAEASPEAGEGRSSTHRGAWVASALAVIGFIVGAGAASRLSVPAPPQVIRAELNVRPAEDLNAGGIATAWFATPGGERTALTWGVDGRSLVFVGRRNGTQQLYVRPLEASEARPLAGTEGAQVPAVSSGQWIAFWAPNALKKVGLSGGPVTEVVSGIEAPPSALAWDGDASLLYSKAEGPIWHVRAGSEPTPVTKLGEAERAHVLSSVLPGTGAILYTVRKRVWTWGDEEVVALELGTGKRKVVLRDAADARYVATGHLAFLRRGVLFAIPFDVERLETLGSPLALVEGVAQALTGGMEGNLTGAGQFTIASTGSLAWIAGPAGVPALDRRLVRVDRGGRVTVVGTKYKMYHPSTVRVSPDGRWLAVPIRALTEVGLWLYDRDRGVLVPVNRRGESDHLTWSPDGRQVTFQWLFDGRLSFARQFADGSGQTEVLAQGAFEPFSWAADGQVLGVIDDDLAIATFQPGPARVQRIGAATAESERWPALSPDRRWLAYGSNVSGRYEIYVQPYPGPGPRTLVSTSGGISPAWHPNGRELFYNSDADATGKRQMMAVGFEPGSTPRIGKARALFAFDNRTLLFSCNPQRCYDVAGDGHGFYVIQQETPAPIPPVTHINLVQNWTEELKAKVPAK